MMTSQSLPEELVEEILSRVPATSLMRWRSICRRWNTLFFEDQRFSDKHQRNAPKQPLVLMLKKYRLFFASVDLNFVPPSIEFSDAHSLKDYYMTRDTYIDKVSHCDGLLLCTTLDDELVVWNPCSGETRWIKRNNGCRRFDLYSRFTLGYENNNQSSCSRSYKILIVDGTFEIYNFNSRTWRVLNAHVNYYNRISQESHSVTFKGNTYWICSDDDEEGDLLSFDFTSERFRRFCFPHATSQHCHYKALSVVREEELSVLCYHTHSSKMEMWVTSKMDTSCEAGLSWNKSFTVDYSLNIYSSVLIDQDKKVALCGSPSLKVGFTIGEGTEYYSEILFEGARSRHDHVFSYVPSLVPFHQCIESDGIIIEDCMVRKCGILMTKTK